MIAKKCTGMTRSCSLWAAVCHLHKALADGQTQEPVLTSSKGASSSVMRSPLGSSGMPVSTSTVAASVAARTLWRVVTLLAAGCKPLGCAGANITAVCRELASASEGSMPARC